MLPEYSMAFLNRSVLKEKVLIESTKLNDENGSTTTPWAARTNWIVHVKRKI
jgi:hypothetical protein